ncbi:MAG: glycoside hydrolase [Oscillospiraceae bacterium]|nr:glycoside hydrolase [Oscillospiraceae bacterium]
MGIGLTESVVWRGGNKEHLYGEFSIPGIVVTDRGTLLAYAEARDYDSVFFRWGDWAAIDIVMKRSVDGGRSWSETKVLCNGTDPKGTGGHRTTNNAVMIADGGLVHMVYSVWYGYEALRGGGVYYARSADDGLTWSEPREISAMCHTEGYPYSLIAAGPGHGIVLSGKSKNPGMLLTPVWMTPYKVGIEHAMQHASDNVVSTLYSLDRGESWRLGEILGTEGEVTCPNETVAVELSGGGVMLNSRNTSDMKRRSVTFGPDGIGGWAPQAFDMALPDPRCFGSAVRYDDETILFVNCANDDQNPESFLAPRKNLTVRASRDDGRTWERSKVAQPGRAGYADIAVGPDKAIYVLYDIEHGAESMNLIKFDLEWLYADD